MKPYVPSGKAAEGALPLMLFAALATALAVGGLANVIGQFFRLLIVFPLVMGLLAGLAVARVAAVKQVRMPPFVIGLGLAAGLLCWCSDFGIDYLRARAAIHDQVEVLAQDIEAQGLGEPGDEDIQRCVDLTLVYWGQAREITPTHIAANLLGEPFSDVSGAVIEPEAAPSALEAFAGHVRSVADEGMTISRAGRGDGDNIGAIGTYLVWLLELLLAVGAAGFVAWEQARQPFCERCKQWYAKQERLVVVAPATKKDEVLRAMQHGDAGAMARLQEPVDPKKPFLALGVRACPKCASGPKYVSVTQVHAKGNKTHRKNLRSGIVGAGTLESILGAMAKALEQDAAAQR